MSLTPVVGFDPLLWLVHEGWAISRDTFSSTKSESRYLSLGEDRLRRQNRMHSHVVRTGSACET